MKLLLAALLLPLAALAQDCTLRAAPEDWPPYLYRNADGQLAGVDLELVRLILRQARCTLQIEKQMPVARRQVLFQQGKLDLQWAASETAERRGYARFTLPYRHETVGLFVLAGRQQRFQDIDSFQDMAIRKMGLLAPRIGFYGDEYERALPLLNADGRRSTFGSFEQGIRMLEAGRGDVIMGDAFALRHMARQLGVAVAELPFVPLRAPVHLMLNAASTTREQLARINQAIATLEQNGALAALRARHGIN